MEKCVQDFENRLGLNSIHLFHFLIPLPVATLCVVTQDKNCVRTEDQCAVNGALSNTCTHVLGRGTVNFFCAIWKKELEVVVNWFLEKKI